MRSAIEREKRQARGIVIRHGASVHEASAFLAYLWSEESTPGDTWRRESRGTSREESPSEVLRDSGQFQTLVGSGSRRGTA